jgi:hypothetical protein
MKPLFVALGLNVITKRFYDSRDVLSANAIRRNVGAGYANLPLCKSQQGSSVELWRVVFRLAVLLTVVIRPGVSPLLLMQQNFEARVGIERGSLPFRA